MPSVKLAVQMVHGRKQTKIFHKKPASQSTSGLCNDHLVEYYQLRECPVAHYVRNSNGSGNRGDKQSPLRSLNPNLNKPVLI
jgi:hypothetical protein